MKSSIIVQLHLNLPRKNCIDIYHHSKFSSSVSIYRNDCVIQLE